MSIRVRRRRIALAVLMVFALIGGTLLAVAHTVDMAVAVDAERRARNWALFLQRETPDVEALIAGRKVPDETIRAVSQMSGIGDVFRVKLFNDIAIPVFISDQAYEALEPGAMTDHNGEAARVLATGEPVVLIEDGNGARNRPRIYAEAYTPVTNAAGDTIGVAEVYIDQTVVSDLFHSVFGVMAMVLAGTFVLVFIGIYAAFIRQHVRAQQSSARADFLENHDPVSGLFNRSGFMIAANRHAVMPRPTRGVATFHIHIDRFKDMNDLHGHGIGDAFLHHVGETLQRLSGDSEIAFRQSGGEFGLMAYSDSLDWAENLAKQIITSIGRPVNLDGITVRGHVSIGVHYSEDRIALEERLHHAGQAMYLAKIDGGHCHRVFTPELERRIDRRKKLEHLVATGLDDELFCLAFQPLIDPRSGQCKGFEALLRLYDGTGHFVSPADFIPIAETTGHINRIGAWVIRKAMIEAKSWPGTQFVAVNLSGHQFTDGHLVAMVADLLAETGLDPARLELEVTESVLIDDSYGAGVQLQQLRDLGVSVAMDDFGTGYSSLGYLWQFGFDRLKIDRSFVTGIATDPDRAREIISTIVTLGHKLDMQVTVEGIERREDAEFLAELSCDLFQGFLFSRPLPANEVKPFLENSRAADVLALHPQREAASRGVAGRN